MAALFRLCLILVLLGAVQVLGARRGQSHRHMSRLHSYFKRQHGELFASEVKDLYKIKGLRHKDLFLFLLSVVICGRIPGSGTCVKYTEPCPPFSDEECRDHLCPFGSGKRCCCPGAG